MRKIIISIVSIGCVLFYFSSCKCEPKEGLSLWVSLIQGYPIKSAEVSLGGVTLSDMGDGFVSISKYYNYADAVSMTCATVWKEIKFSIRIPYIPLSGEAANVTFNFISHDATIWFDDVLVDPNNPVWNEYKPTDTTISGWVKIDPEYVYAPIAGEPLDAINTRNTANKSDGRNRPPFTCNIEITSDLKGKPLNIKITEIY